MPDSRESPLGGSPSPRPVAHPVLPLCVYPAPYAQLPRPREPPPPLWPPLSDRGGYLADLRAGPQVAWRGTRDYHGPPYVEPNPGLPPPCALCGDRWSIGPRCVPLDTHQAPRLSLSRHSARPRVARQISHRSPQRLCAGPSPVSRGHSAPGGRPDLPAFPRAAVAAALGRLCQAAFCLGAARPLVSG